MAQHVRVELVDDLDGSPAQETVEFGLDGLLYQIDLSTVNADQLRATFAPYIAGARRSQARAKKARQQRGQTDHSTARIRQLTERVKSQRSNGSEEPEPNEGEPVVAEETMLLEASIPAPSPEVADDGRTSTVLAPVFQPPQR